MNYIEELTQDELKYICKTIPFSAATGYFRRYPKEFTKIRPGFRVKSLTEEMVTKLLYDFRSREFIGNFITKTVNQWIKEIDEELEKILQEGKTHEAAYIEVLSRSFFVDNIPLYYKIIGEEKTEEYLAVMGEAVLYQADKNKNNHAEIEQIKKKEAESDKRIEELNQKIAEGEKKTDRLSKKVMDLNSILERKDAIIDDEKKKNDEMSITIASLEKKLTKAEEEDTKKAEEFVKKTALLINESEKYEKQIDELKSLLEDANNTINEYHQTIVSSKDGKDALSAANKVLESQVSDLKTKIHELEEEIITFKTDKNESEEKVNRLQNDKAAIDSYNKELQQTIRDLKETLETENDSTMNTDLYDKNDESLLQMTPFCPEDMDDFEEYFLYNFENIGICETDEGASSLIEYIKQIVFDGIPLLIKRGPGINLANCLVNTICGHSSAQIYSYENGIQLSDVDIMLGTSKERIVCLDGFVGNCNEIELLAILGKHRNKIIILTYMYDKTLKYIPSEILSSVWFISMDKFSAIMQIKDITEDSSEILEKTNFYQKICTDNRSRKIFMEIAQECGIDYGTACAISNSIKDEAAMNRILLFTLLPYVANVLGMNPYNCSKRLQKYAGETGKCLNREIIMRWFG